jgi:hypothetical protein
MTEPIMIKTMLADKKGLRRKKKKMLSVKREYGVLQRALFDHAA